MNYKNSRIILEDQQRDLLYEKNKSNLRISFNRISFVFYFFLIVFLIYSIHLTHLGSRKDRGNIEDLNREFTKNLYRADILDRNGRYLVKTVSSIDIGISSQKVIDKKKLIINLKYIFPNKKLKKLRQILKIKNSFGLKKKFQMKTMKR